MLTEKRKAIFYLFIVLTFVIFIIIIQLSLEKIVNDKDQPVVSISKFLVDGKYIRERILQPDEYGKKVLVAKFDGDFLDKIDGDISLLAARLRGTCSEIYVNGHLIGKIGIIGNNYINTWNEVNKFDINRNYLFSGKNTLKIVSYSDAKIGVSGFPIYISGDAIIELLYSKIEFLYNQFYDIAFGMLVAISLIQFFVFSTQGIFEKKHYLFPAVVLILALTMHDYILKYMLFLTVFAKTKLFYLLLYMTSSLYAKALLAFYGAKRFFKIAVFVSIVSAILVILAPNPTFLLHLGYSINLILLLGVLASLFIFVKSYYKRKSYIDLIMIMSTTAFIIPSLIEALSLKDDYIRFRLAALGFVLFAIGISIISLELFRQKVIEKVKEAERLKQESEQLKRNLYIDELTNLCNYRCLVDKLKALIKTRNDNLDVLVIDIDKFNMFNDVNGYDKGDIVLKEIANIMRTTTQDDSNCFRYSGKTFVYLNFDKEKSVLELAENIRYKVQVSKKIIAMGSSTPLTVSCGISSFPTDASEALAVISNANLAVQVAKKRGRNRIVRYHKELTYELEDSSFVNFKQQMIIDFMYSLANVIDMKDKYTGHHSEAVSKMSVLIGESLGLSDEDLTALRLGSILHDFGKIGMPDSIINKKGRLTDEEYAIMKQHPEKGYNIIKQVIDNKKVLEIIKYHHERIDGKGYPEQLKGQQIPYLARIVCVADAFHAMISTRSYRQALSNKEAIDELLKWRGKQFDAEIVDAFIPIVDDFELASDDVSGLVDEVVI